MHEAITVRPAVPEDARAIAVVHATSWRETYARLVGDPDHPAFAVEPRVPGWERHLAAGSTDTVVAVHGDQVIGFAETGAAEGTDAPRAVELTMLYVLATAHGTGTGQALLDAVLGDRPASLWVAADNPRAQAFYRRNGFRADGAVSEFPPVGATVRLVR
jgi:ribosomal protein S18 acetylase RimI-like enzyme